MEKMIFGIVLILLTLLILNVLMTNEKREIEKVFREHFILLGIFLIISIFSLKYALIVYLVLDVLYVLFVFIVYLINCLKSEV